jgi:hypothetical protein
MSNYFNPNISPLKMLSMKNAILILTTVFLGFTAMSFDLFHPSIIANEEDIEIVFTKSMDKAQLEAIQKDLSEKGIILTYNALKFRKNGKLKRIDFTVDCPKHGFKGTASNGFLGFVKKFGFALEGIGTDKGKFTVGAI